ncbi:protein-disulfide reductase DsbD domain-containing protein, partial [Hansschlegelia zhihuaiae]
DAGPAGGGARLAAISIQLDPGWKTYWRQPGASGVPPRFDFSGSDNVAEARVAYPAPERSADADGVTNVYHGVVTLPVTVRPKDPQAPVELRVVADYGVCEAVCVPIRAEAELELSPSENGAGPEADEVRRAADAAPKPAALGGAGPLSVVAVRRAGATAEGGAALEIAVSAPDGPEPELFAETGEGDFAPAPELIGRQSGGRATFRMAFDETELPASGLRLTLASGGRAVETPVPLDAIAARP